MAIQIGGLATGLDTKALIEGLMAAERVPVNRMQARRASVQSRLDAFAALRPKVSELETQAKGLKTVADFRSFKASSSAESFATASASGAAAAGVYSVEITQLAENEIEKSNGYADKGTTTVGTGTLSLTVGGVVTNVAIGAGDQTLQGVANAINDSDAKVSASVVNVGGTNPYRLVISADEAGDSNTVSVNAAGLSGGTQALSFTEQRAAKSALFSVNGIDIEANSNVVSDAVEGVTFTLKKETEADAPVTVTVTADAEALKKKIESLVSAYNGVVDRLARDGSRNATTGATGVLFGDFTATSIKRRLAAAAAGAVSTDDGAYNSLGSIGVTTTRTGSLAVDSAKLTKAIESDPEGVIALFVDGDGGLASKFADLANVIASSTGEIAAREAGLKTGVKTIDTQIERFEARLVRVEKQLTTRYAELESFASRFQGLGTLLQQKLSSLNS